MYRSFDFISLDLEECTNKNGISEETDVAPPCRGSVLGFLLLKDGYAKFFCQYIPTNAYFLHTTARFSHENTQHEERKSALLPHPNEDFVSLCRKLRIKRFGEFEFFLRTSYFS